MDNYFSYLIESVIVFSILYVLYLLLFAHTTYFKLNRIYLIITVLLSVLIPLIKFNIQRDNPLVQYAFEFDPVLITGAEVRNSGTVHSLIRILLYIYFSGAVLIALRFLMQLANILILVKRAKTIKEDGVKIVVTDKNCPPFSFFNIIFLPYQKKEAEVIVHERTHCRQGHSFDVMIMEIMTVVQWFNPLIWLYRSSLKTVHEFLADEGVLLKGFDRPAYQDLLLEKAFGVRLSSLAANFNYSPLKKRIKMMTKNKSGRKSLLKYILIIPFLAGTIIYFGCSINEELKDDPYNEEVAVNQDQPAFVVVEEMPKFQGEESYAFRKWLSENVRYPKEAVENNISGKVYVKFIVASSGKIKDVSIERNAHPLLDEEALRVVRSSPDWKPGKQRGVNVDVEMVVPITFSAGDK